MKYVVELNGERIEVVIDGAGLSMQGQPVDARLVALAGTPVRLLTVGEVVHRLMVQPGEAKGRYSISLAGWRFDVEALDERTRTIRDLEGANTGPSGPVPLKAPMPGLIVRVLVSEGDRVQAGQGLVVMEAMKMENELRSAGAGVVKRIAVPAGTAVEKGTLLVEIEP